MVKYPLLSKFAKSTTEIIFLVGKKLKYCDQCHFNPKALISSLLFPIYISCGTGWKNCLNIT